MPLIDPKKRITVGPDENGNIFYLRAKMDIATEAAVIAEYGRLSRGLATIPEKVYYLALLKHNLLAWSGPDYMDEKGNLRPCNPVTIGHLDPDDPLVTEAVEAIRTANTSPEAKTPGGDEDDRVADVGAQTSEAAVPNE